MYFLKKHLFLNRFFLTLMFLLLGFLVSQNILANQTLNEIQMILNKRSHPAIANHNASSIQNKKTRFINKAVYSLKAHYEFILFYRAGCPHCQQFDPILKRYSKNSSIPVKAFTFDGVSLPSFPQSIPVNRAIVKQYFGQKEIEVPTLFILNKSTQHAYPVSVGELSYLDLVLCMNQLVPEILAHEGKIYA